MLDNNQRWLHLQLCICSVVNSHGATIQTWLETGVVLKPHLLELLAKRLAAHYAF